MHCVHKPALRVLLLFTANTVQESIPVQENIEVPAAITRDGFKCKFNYYRKVILVFTTCENITSYVWCFFIYWWCLLIALQQVYLNKLRTQLQMIFLLVTFFYFINVVVMKCSPSTGQVLETFTSQVRKQRNMVRVLKQLLTCMFSSNDII